MEEIKEENFFIEENRRKFFKLFKNQLAGREISLKLKI